MPKRKRSRERPASGLPAPAERVLTEQERATRLFAESLRIHDAADRAERQRVQDAAARAALHQQLLSTKRVAVERLKQLRAADRRRPDELAEAEATYRMALAELQEFETGVRPHWAPRKHEPTGHDPSTEHDGENSGSET